MVIAYCRLCGEMWRGTEEDVSAPDTVCPCCYPGISVGSRVVCVNAANHAWFLLPGAVYRVNQVRGSYLNLEGRAGWWPLRQFRKALSDELASIGQSADPANLDAWADYVARHHGWTPERGWPR